MYQWILFVCVFVLLMTSEAHSKTFVLAQSDIVGEVSHYQVKPGETLYMIARRFDLGIKELRAANPGVNPWQPKPETSLIIPSMHILPDTEHKGIVINLADFRLFYFPDDKTVMTFPVGIGRNGWQTPLGKTSVTLKRKNPVWVPPPSIREENPALPEFVPSGPDNPLGEYAINLAMPRIVIHGTNKPNGVGTQVSHGCIRMFPEDIEALYNAVAESTAVTIIDQPYLLGWKENTLYLAVSSAWKQDKALFGNKKIKSALTPTLYHAIIRKTPHGNPISWQVVDRMLEEHSGIPASILIRSLY